MDKNQLFIAGFEIEDFKRIRFAKFTIEPTIGLVKVGGPNAAGKTSVIHFLEAALLGPKRALGNPTRRGAEVAKGRVFIPPYEVRRFWVDGKPGLKIINTDDQSEVKNPTEFLKEIMGNGGGKNPFEFIDAQPIEQRTILLETVGLDTSEIDDQIRAATQHRRELEDNQKKAEARVEGMPFHADAPENPVDISELQSELKTINEHNAAIVTAKQKFEQDQSLLQVAGERHTIQCSTVDALKKQLADAEAKLADYASERDRLIDQASASGKAYNAMEERSDAEVQAKISGITEINEKVRQNKARIEARNEWKNAESEIREAIAACKTLESRKRSLLAGVTFPVDGLGFDEKQVTFNDVPFSQASRAEQVRVGVALYLAQPGRLKFIPIPDASVLDAQSLELVAQCANDHNALVLAEIIANPTEDGFDAECSFYMVDGESIPNDKKTGPRK